MSLSIRASILTAMLVAPALPVHAQRAAVPPAPQPAVPARPHWLLPAPASVMWIGAHPDDEVSAAPLLAHWCGDGRARCILLTATRGEAGRCLLSAGCRPDLATVRSAEAGASSRFFRADAILLSLPDGGGVAPPPGDPAAGGSSDLVTTLAAFIATEAPEIVLTFDPRHGTTCHPDHRAIGAAVLEAVKRMSAPPDVYLLETRLEVDLQPAAVRFSSATSEATRFDANAPLAATGEPAWSALPDVMARYPSQFDASLLAAASSVPAADRAVAIAPAPAILARPVSTCP